MAPVCARAARTPPVRHAWGEDKRSIDSEEEAKEKDEVFNDVMNRIAMLSHTRGIDITSCYADVQLSRPAVMFPRHCGKITRPMFVQRFPFIHELSEAELWELMDHYRTDFDGVLIHDFRRDVDLKIKEREVMMLQMQRASFPVSSVLSPDVAAVLEGALDQSATPIAPQPARSLLRRPASASSASSGFSQRSRAHSSIGSVGSNRQMGSSQVFRERPVPQLFVHGVSLQSHDYGSAKNSGRDRDVFGACPNDSKTTIAPPGHPRPRRPISALGGRVMRFDALPRIDAFTKLKSLVAERRIRPISSFLDFDRLRRGTCTASHLRAALTFMGIDLDAESFEAIFNLFRSDDGKFKYRDFCAKVQEPPDHGEAGTLGQTPQVSRPGSAVMSRPASAAAARLSRPTSAVQHNVAEKADPSTKRPTSAMSGTLRYKVHIGDAENEQLQDLKNRMRAKALLRRMELKTIFDDFNRRTGIAVAGHVTSSQVPRILAMLGFVLSDTQVDLLLQAYCDTQDGQGFNYMEFCVDIDPFFVENALGRSRTRPCSATSGGTTGIDSESSTRSSSPVGPTTVYFDYRGKVVPRSRPNSAPHCRRTFAAGH